MRDASGAFSFRQIPENHSFSFPSQNDRSPHIEVSGRFVFYPMQLVTPSVVAIAVSMLMAICRIVFQVFAFIFLNVEC